LIYDIVEARRYVLLLHNSYGLPTFELIPVERIVAINFYDFLISSSLLASILLLFGFALAVENYLSRPFMGIVVDGRAVFLWDIRAPSLPTSYWSDYFLLVLEDGINPPIT
jgi:hypothetical protein